jgi:hypothetical protein
MTLKEVLTLHMGRTPGSRGIVLDAWLRKYYGVSRWTWRRTVAGQLSPSRQLLDRIFRVHAERVGGRLSIRYAVGPLNFRVSNH